MITSLSTFVLSVEKKNIFDNKYLSFNTLFKSLIKRLLSYLYQQLKASDTPICAISYLCIALE